MLPYLIEKGLIKDDSSRYALVSYPRSVISKSARFVIESIGEKPDSYKFDSKHRIEFIMEFMAVALSMPMSEVRILEIAVNFYSNWLNDFSFLGDSKEQNEYVRLIIKQLSLPFDLAHSTNFSNLKYFPGQNAQGSMSTGATSGSISSLAFQKKFISLMFLILRTYNLLHTEKGTLLEKETWITLLYTIIGISDYLTKFPLTTHMTEEEASKLKESTMTICFSVLKLSGILDADVWQKFMDYAQHWSADLNFLTVWDTQVNKMFILLLSRKYNYPKLTETYKGVYTHDNPISEKTIGLIFRNFLNGVNIKTVSKSPELLKSFLSNFRKLTKITKKVFLNVSTFFIHPFSANSILKLFGKFITFCKPVQDNSYDEAYAIVIEIILNIISSFGNPDEEELLASLFAYGSQFVLAEHSAIIFSFLNSGNNVFGSTSMVNALPLVAELALNTISQVNFKNDQKDINHDSLIGLFLSSSELLLNENCSYNYSIKPEANSTLLYSNYKYSIIESAFQNLWTGNKHLNAKYSLIWFIGGHILRIINTTNQESLKNCAILLNQLNILSKVDEYFNEDIFKTISTTGKNVYFLIGLIFFLGEYSRLQKFIPNSRFEHEIEENNTISKLSTNLMKIDSKKIEAKLNILVLSILETLGNFANFTTIFNKKQNSTQLFSVYGFIMKNLDLFKSTNSTTPPNMIITAAQNMIVNGCMHSIPSEIFTHKLDSANELINEELIIKKYFSDCSPNDVAVNYFTLGNSLLISFIERTNGQKPFVLLIRGVSFGRAVYLIEDDYQGSLPTPQLSNEIQPVDLPLPHQIQIAKIETYGTKVNAASVIDHETLSKFSEALCKFYSDDYVKWQSQNLLPEYGLHASYQRLRVVDFISTLGLTEHQNRLELRIQNNIEQVKNVINELDRVSDFSIIAQKQIIPIIVRHIGIDSNLNNLKENDKMTPVLLDFLNHIGNPIEIDDYTAEKHGLCKLKTPVPSFSLINGIGVVLTSTMARNGIREFEEMIERLNPPAIILFNETNYDLKIPVEKDSTTIQLVLRPQNKNSPSSGLYHLKKLVDNDILSPLPHSALLSPKTLVFALTLIADSALCKRPGESSSSLRRQLIGELCKEPIKNELGPLLAGSFESA